MNIFYAAFALVHLGHAVGVDVDGVKLAGLDAGAQAETAVGAVQVITDIHATGKVEPVG